MLLSLLAAAAAWIVVVATREPADTRRPDANAAATDVPTGDPVESDAAIGGSARPPEDAPRARPEPRARAVAPEPKPDPSPKPAQSGVELRGHVRFADGRPATGAVVRAWRLGASGGGVPRIPAGESSVSGEHGRYTIGGAYEGARYILYAALPGHETVGDTATPSATGSDTDLVLAGPGTCTLTGTVRGVDGSPLSDREVRLFPTDRWKNHVRSGRWKFWAEPAVWEFYGASTRTDAEGRYRFDGLAPPTPTGGPRPRAAVVTDDEGGRWASDPVEFGGASERAVRDVAIGTNPWLGDSVDPPGLIRSVHVRVLTPDGSDVPEAKVRLTAFSETRITSWQGQRNDHGFFVAVPQGEFLDDDARMFLSVSTPDYESWAGAVSGDAMVVRLEPAPTTASRGRITGTLTSESGDALALPAFAELLVIDLVTFEKRRHGTVVAADGTFAAEGIEAGPKLASFDERRNWKEIRVPPGGESCQRYVSEHKLDRLESPEQVERNREALRELRGELRVVLKPPGGTGRVLDEERVAELQGRIAALELRQRGPVFAEVPGGGDGWVTVWFGPEFQTVGFRDGRAEFPAARPGEFPAVVCRDGQADERTDLELRPSR